MRTEALAAPGSPRDLRRDERGAIMVLGIFMCACMVGALWYLSGIGDAIVYRQRMQEGADAVAFSGAVLHARGMNLIVLLNLIMALILAVRVALKALYLGLTIIAAILAAFVVTAPAAPPFTAAAQVTNTTLTTLREPINQAIRLLSNAQTVIARVVPPASLVGSYQVGERYSPIVRDSIAGNTTTVPQGLPVEEDTPDHLCQKAGEAVGSVLGELVPIPGLGSGLGSVVGSLARAGGFYFCEIGSGTSAPNVGQGTGAASEETCNEQQRQLQKQADDARKAYDDQCAALRCNDPNTKLTPEQQSQLGALSAQKDAQQRAVDGFNRDRCMRDNARTANQVAQREMQNSPGGSGRGMTPKKIRDRIQGKNYNWKNGVNEAQVVAIARGDTQMLRAGATGARVGAWRTPITITTPQGADFAIAQAEFFFDCNGVWTGRDCNGSNAESNSMWRLRWRARLRRFNNPFINDGSLNVADMIAGAGVLRTVLGSTGDISVSPQNLAILGELARIAGERELIVH